MAGRSKEDNMYDDDPTLERRLKAKDKLIAELLDALEAVEPYMQYASNWTGERIEAVEKLERAIRKARGG